MVMYTIRINTVRANLWFTVNNGERSPSVESGFEEATAYPSRINLKQMHALQIAFKYFTHMRCEC